MKEVRGTKSCFFSLLRSTKQWLRRNLCPLFSQAKRGKKWRISLPKSVAGKNPKQKQNKTSTTNTMAYDNNNSTSFLPILTFENRGGLYLFLNVFQHLDFEEVERHFPVLEERAASFPGTTEAHNSTAFSDDIGIRKRRK